MSKNEDIALSPLQIAEAVIAHFDFDDLEFERKLLIQIEGDVSEALDQAQASERERCAGIVKRLRELRVKNGLQSDKAPMFYEGADAACEYIFDNIQDGCTPEGPWQVIRTGKGDGE